MWFVVFDGLACLRKKGRNKTQNKYEKVMVQSDIMKGQMHWKYLDIQNY